MQGALPEAAAFLALVSPWPIGDGPEYFINIHRRVPLLDRQTNKPRIGSDGKPVMYFNGRATASVADAIGYIRAVENKETADTYVCMSGQVGGELTAGRGGQLYRKAERSSDNAVFMKGLWLDVDVKPGNVSKGYETSSEAVQEFGRIRRAIGLPVPSVCISSGSGGFHAHWVFEDRMEPGVWEPLAHALVRAFVEKGFRGDTGCTIDASRLLRVPGTWNHKQVDAGTGPKLPVTTFHLSGNIYPNDFMQKTLQPWVGLVPVTLKTRPTANLLPGHIPECMKGLAGDELSSGIEARPMPSINDIAKACPFVLRSLVEHGKSNNNAQWLNTANIALFSSEGRDAFHWMSSGHPTYNFNETEALWLRQKDTKARTNMGWPQCRTIAGNGATECQNCPHFKEGKSPLNFVEYTNPVAAAVALEGAPPTVNPAAAAVMPPLPAGYSYGPHGIVLRSYVDDDGKIHKEPVTMFPMLRPWLQDQPATLNFTTVIGGSIGQADAYERQVSMPLSHVHDISAMAKNLAEQHMVLNPNSLGDFRSFLVSWSDTLRKQRENIIHTAPYGWFQKDGKPGGFIFAKQVWTDGAPRPAANPDPVLERQYTPTGEIEPWLAAATMITNQARPEFDAILASAFAAPLVSCVGQTGLLMSTYSPESGIGKSTALRVAQAVWGHPVMAVQSLGDTQNSVIKKMGDLKALPVYWDELKTDVDHAKFVSLAFQLAQGKEKSRLSSDVTYRAPGTWETLMVSASNDSLINHIVGKTRTTSAGMMRIFEFRVRPGVQGRIDISLAQNIIGALSHNYGNAGLAYAKFLGKEHIAVHAEVQKLLLEIEKEFSVATEERFWLSLVTVILAGARFANHLKLTKINEANLRRFMFEQFDEQRRERSLAPVDITSQTTLSDHLVRFLNEQRTRYMLRTNIIWTSAARPTGVIVHHDPNSRFESAHIQTGDDFKMRIIKSVFVHWLREEGLSDRMILQELARQSGMVEVRGRLGAGTPYVTHPEPVLDFDLSHPWFASWS